MLKDASLSDGDCIRRLQQNDELALATLMEMYYCDLYHYASRFSKDEPMIKDCIQEVFISLWQRRSSAAVIESPKYYLVRAIKNKILKALYEKNKYVGLNSVEQEYEFVEGSSIERIIIDKQLTEGKANTLRNSFSQLSQRQKEVIYLKYYQHFDNGQIAELMNISRQSVYNLMLETIQKIKTIMKADYLLDS